MGFLQNLFSSAGTSLVDSVGKVLDNVITTKEEKQTLDVELKKSEMDYQIEMQKLSIEERKMMIEDTADARNREIEIAKSEYATTLSKNVGPYLAIGTVILAFILFYVLIFRPDSIDDKTKEIVMYILGILSAIMVQIYSYYFGSSASSKAKDETIAAKKFNGFS